MDHRRHVEIVQLLRRRGSVNVLLLRYLAGDHEKLPLELDHVRALVASTDDEASQSEALAAIAYFEAYAGHINQALSDANSALSIAKRMGSDRHTCSALMAMAMAHLRTGDANEAVRCATESVKHADACGFAWVSVASTWINCKARIAAGDFSRTTMVGLARVVTVSATDRDVTSWLVGIVCAAYVLLKNGNSHRAAELVGIANRQGNRLGFAPEAMDPVETRQFLTEIMRCVDEQELTTAYEKGWALDARQTFSRVDELVEEALN